MGLNLVDQYSLLHFATGIIFYFFGISLPGWAIIHVLFEAIENTSFGIDLINNYLTFWPGGKPYPDSFINIIGDTIVGLLGWVIAYILDKYGEKYKWYK
jgi:hypothetical protein